MYFYVPVTDDIAFWSLIPSLGLTKKCWHFNQSGTTWNARPLRETRWLKGIAVPLITWLGAVLGSHALGISEKVGTISHIAGTGKITQFFNVQWLHTTNKHQGILTLSTDRMSRNGYSPWTIGFCPWMQGWTHKSIHTISHSSRKKE